MELNSHAKQKPGSSGSKRMSERNRSAIDIDLVAVETEFSFAGEVLHGKGFIDLKEIDVVHRQAGIAQSKRDGRYRTNPHDLGRDAHERVSDDPDERL